ncbi:MAG TPA: helix-turn-helix transcriptional regulator [Casimicrobiaceae bacterium]
MPNVGSVLREEITRLSRREIRRQTQHTKKLTAEHRHHIAALNRKLVELERTLTKLVRHAASQTSAAAGTSGHGTEGPKLRFVAKGLRSHRDRLGLSASDFGKLVGVSANSVYAWESGTTTPRREQLAKIAALRTMGKREAMKRLEAAPTAKVRPRRKR